MPVRLATNGHLNCKTAGLLLADHGRAEEAQHLIDWIRDRISAAAGESNPIARGLVATSSTISEPESPLFKNLLALFPTTIWPVNVLVKAAPPGAFVIVSDTDRCVQADDGAAR